MHFPTFTFLLAVTGSLATCYASPYHLGRDFSTNVATPQLPFNFTYLFTAQLALGQAEKPISIPGGVRVVEPILNGTVSGPAINATLGRSLASPSITNNGTLSRPIINAFGTTDDGFPFRLYETGVGSVDSQVTRIVSIGCAKLVHGSHEFTADFDA